MARREKETTQPVTKVRKKRKPMTEEQRAAAAERLAKARAKRAAANPPQYKNVHPDVLALPEDHALSFPKVREWIKFNKELLTSTRQDVRRGVKGSEAKAAALQAYLNHMDAYLRTSDWIDNFYGQDRNLKMTFVSVVPAYDKDGNIKRQQGVYYADLGYVWGSEPVEEEEEVGVLPL